jgi:hypothetical protein
VFVKSYNGIHNNFYDGHTRSQTYQGPIIKRLINLIGVWTEPYLTKTVKREIGCNATVVGQNELGQVPGLGLRKWLRPTVGLTDWILIRALTPEIYIKTMKIQIFLIFISTKLYKIKGSWYFPPMLCSV